MENDAFSVGELLALLRNKTPTILEELAERGALELLFEASVIGIRVGGAGSTRFKSDDPDLRLPASGAVYVRQSLYKGLTKHRWGKKTRWCRQSTKIT